MSDDPGQATTPDPRRRLAWRLLGGFWALVLLGGGTVLLALGPPAPTTLAEAPADAAPPGA